MAKRVKLKVGARKQQSLTRTRFENETKKLSDDIIMVVRIEGKPDVMQIVDVRYGMHDGERCVVLLVRR